MKHVKHVSTPSWLSTQAHQVHKHVKHASTQVREHANHVNHANHANTQAHHLADSLEIEYLDNMYFHLFLFHLFFSFGLKVCVQYLFHVVRNQTWTKSSKECVMWTSFKYWRMKTISRKIYVNESFFIACLQKLPIFVELIRIQLRYLSPLIK